ncbi:MAG TPA: SDR family oxidoreductase [Bryobacteraceae bacterium]|jgi:3-oxoacyl-[acyl-carrier protein] reductase
MSQRVGIVTGAARGIGRATAIRLAEDGWSLVLSGRSEEELASLTGEIEKGGGKAVPVIGDLREGATPDRLVEAAMSKFGQLDALINAAGIAKNVPLLELDLATWQDLFDLHVTATFRCCQAAGKAMVAQGTGGCIVNVGSVAASMAMYTTGAYAAAKGAVASFSRVLAVELAPHNIRVNTVAPGPVATEQLRKVYEGPKYAERSRSIPMNRLAEPGEVGDLIAFLVSPQSAYITGQVFTIDGGAQAVGCYSYETYKRHAPK